MRTALALVFSALMQAQMFSPPQVPVVQNAGETKATMWWLDNRDGYGEVKFSSADGELSSVPAAARDLGSLFRYEANLSGLRPEQLYSYVACVNDDCTPEGTFQTAPVSKRPFCFVAFGDNGSGPVDLAQKIAATAANSGCVGVLHVGDFTHTAAPQEYVVSLGAYASLLSRMAFWPALGNHDVWTSQGRDWIVANQSLPCNGVPLGGCGRYYSFDWGNAHITVLDSNEMDELAEGSPMLEWLKRDLSTTKQPWKIVTFHHPPFVSGRHATDPFGGAVRQNVVPILERYGVQLVLSGHQHGYSRTLRINGVTYVITAGGGSPLYEADLADFQAVNESTFNYLIVEVVGGKLAVRAIRLRLLDNGDVVEDGLVDSFVLSAGAPSRPGENTRR